jgi:hypothetical protein
MRQPETLNRRLFSVVGMTGAADYTTNNLTRHFDARSGARWRACVQGKKQSRDTTGNRSGINNVGNESTSGIESQQHILIKEPMKLCGIDRV